MNLPFLALSKFWHKLSDGLNLHEQRWPGSCGFETQLCEPNMSYMVEEVTTDTEDEDEKTSESARTARSRTSLSPGFSMTRGEIYGSLSVSEALRTDVEEGIGKLSQ